MLKTLIIAMPILIEIARAYEREEKIEGEEVLEEGFCEHGSKRAESIRNAVRIAYDATGIDMKEARAETLGTNILGEFHTDDRSIRIDLKKIEDEDLLTHTLIHEGNHAENHKRSDEVLADHDFAEVLTEAATAQETGEVLAYQEHRWKLDHVVAQSGETRSRVIELFQQGKNAELNGLYRNTFAKKAA